MCETDAEETYERGRTQTHANQCTGMFFGRFVRAERVHTRSISCAGARTRTNTHMNTEHMHNRQIPISHASATHTPTHMHTHTNAFTHTQMEPKTIFNILGPLVNPAHPRAFVIGAYPPAMAHSRPHILSSP